MILSIESFNKATRDFRTEWSQAKSKEAKDELVRTKLPKAKDYAERFLAIYESDRDSEIGLKALEWVASRDREGEFGKQAFATLMKEHPESEALPGMVYGMQRGKPSQSTEDALRQIIDGDATEELKGVATISLASYLKNVGDMKESIDQYRKMMDMDTIAYIESLDVTKDELLSLYKKVKEDYGDVRISRFPESLGEMASGELFVMEKSGRRL